MFNKLGILHLHIVNQQKTMLFIFYFEWNLKNNIETDKWGIYSRQNCESFHH